MKKLMHIIASPRGEESRTLKVSNSFIESFKKNNPDCDIDALNVFEENLPELTVKSIDGKYMLLGGKDLPEELKESWNEIIATIERFLSADVYLVSTPMWNFSHRVHTRRGQKDDGSLVDARPASAKWQARLEPIKPAPPASSIFMSFLL